jgi:hypothetical protein
MTDLQTRIQNLNDQDAQRILTTLASHQPNYQTGTLTPELTAALQNEPKLTATTADAGDLSRTALLLLADNSHYCPIIDTMTRNAGAQQYAVLESAAVVGAALFVLGTHVKVERDKKGNWSFKIEKKPTDNALLKALMEKLLGFTQNRS